MEMSAQEVVLKAEDILHVLRDGIAILPGSRDRNGRAILIFPSKEQQVNPDHIRNLLLYLQTVTADAAKEKGFSIIIDMRGKQTWNNVRPILKAISQLNDIHPNLPLPFVFIIKPDKFWEKQKAQISLGSYKFEVHMLSHDSLNKHFDFALLPRELGGTYPYDHDEWIETRLDLERWIWHISDVMRGLEQHRSAICNEMNNPPLDVNSADAAIKQHSVTKRAILAIPIDRIQSEANKIQDRINNPSISFKNPDLQSVLPHLTNLVASLLKLKSEVFKLWEKRRTELENVYQMKIFEHDADEMMSWLRSNCDSLQRRMGDVGSTESEAADRVTEFDDFSRAASNTEVNMSQISNLAKRIQSACSPQCRSHVERISGCLDEEWTKFQDLILRRKSLLRTTVEFFRAANSYFAQYSEWSSSIGIDPSSVNALSSAQLEEGIQRHENFWVAVEESFAVAANQSNQLRQAFRTSGMEEALVGGLADLVVKLPRYHKQLHDTWKERKIRLNSMLALIAFQSDTQRVIEWLEQHGEPYLRKNTGIGDNVEQAKTFQRNHRHFSQIAQNTYHNSEKLFAASRTLVTTGICDADRMNELVGDLEMRIERFSERVDQRAKVLNLSVLFHTHYNEILNWYSEMEEKYRNQRVESDVDVAERVKERWLLESDGTAQAYATTIGEGQQLLRELSNASQSYGVDYSASINQIRRLMGNIDQRNAVLTDQWSSRRFLLQVALRFAQFLKDTTEILAQIQNWAIDMQGMLDSPTFVGNVSTIQPLHRDNTAQVKSAVREIKTIAHETEQAILRQGLEGLQTTNGDNVLNLIRSNLKLLDGEEKIVMKLADETSKRLEGARQIHQAKRLAKDIYADLENEERKLAQMCSIPSTLDEAYAQQETNKEHQNRMQGPVIKSVKGFLALTHQLFSMESGADRAHVVELNEHVLNKVRRLQLLIQDQEKLLKAAVACYKTYNTGVVPILEQLEKEYSQIPDKDWCAGRSMDSPEERATFVSELLSKHGEYKEKFLKGCSYANKTSDVFYKCIQRSTVGAHYRKQHEDRIHLMKSNLRERESRILELWTMKKKQLESCQQYILLDLSGKEITDWLAGEGESGLSKFLRLMRNRPPHDESLLEDFAVFKLAVKEKRSHVQSTLALGQSISAEVVHHKEDVFMVMDDVKQRFEVFSKRVFDCECTLRGIKPQSSKDELSLDRRSDASVEEKLEIAKREERRRMHEPLAELLKSERDYIEDLKKCIDIYIKDFDAAVTTAPASIRGKRGEIFANIEDIYEFHSKTFMKELSKYSDDPEQVGCSFTVWVDLLNDLYTEYCANMNESNRIIALPDAMSFFTGIRERHHLEVNHDICSLLIKPVQRITRYGLLMGQLFKNCTGNVEEIREAFEVVNSVPRRANDIIHLKCLEKEKLGSTGAFVITDAMTVWEPRSYFKGKERERQVFLFEAMIVFAKKIELSPTTNKYTPKGKPIPLSEVSVVEHVEGDVTRFGLRVGTVASNENRIDIGASSEQAKVSWVKKIRELTQGMLKLHLGMEDLDLASSSAASIVSARSLSTRSSGDRLSRDADSLTINEQRHSIISADSTENAADLWVISSDFDAQAEGQLSVKRGERVEMVEPQPTDCADWVQITIYEDAQRTGLVPVALLLSDEPSSSTDRPEVGSANNQSATKRKSLRRIFANSGKDRQSSSPQRHSNGSVSAAVSSVSQPPPAIVMHPSEDTVQPSVLSTLVTATGGGRGPDCSSTAGSARDAANDDTLLVDGAALPPPMEDLALNNSHMASRKKRTH